MPLRKKSRIGRRFKGKNRLRKGQLLEKKENGLQTIQQSTKDTIILEFPDNTILFDMGCPDDDIHDLLCADESTLHNNTSQLSEMPLEFDHRFWEIPGLFQMDCVIEKPNDHEVTDSDGISGDMFYVILDKVYQYDPSVDLDEFVKVKRYSKLKRECRELSLERYIMLPSSSYIRFLDFYDNRDQAAIKSCITVNEDFTATVVVHDCKLPSDHFIWKNLPPTFASVHFVHKLIREISSYNVCLGNPEKSFQENLPSNYYPLVPSDNCKGYQELNKGAYVNGFSYKSTIRSSYCTLLTMSARCKHCQSYRSTLRKRNARMADKILTHEKNWLSSRKGNKKLTESEKLIKLNQMTSKVKLLALKHKKSFKTEVFS